MVASPTPEAFQIDTTEESSDEEQDQFEHEISFYPSDWAEVL